MTAEGVWNVYIDTPLGRQHAIVRLSNLDGGLVGTATDARSGEKVPLTEVAVDGDPKRLGETLRKAVATRQEPKD